jgi:hypothetical protein
LRRSNFRVRRADSVVRLSNAGVLQFLLPLIVDERVLTGTHRGFGLVYLRPEVVIAQLDEQITGPHRLIIGYRYRSHQASYLRAEGRKVCLHVRVVCALPSAVANPSIPIARD